jgi:hypothetical protein
LNKRWANFVAFDRKNFTRKPGNNYTLNGQSRTPFFVHFPKNYLESPQINTSRFVNKNSLARHARCDVYCGARETVGESSVSSGCWGEDSDHEYGWARRTPTFVAPIRFLMQLSKQNSRQK